MFLLRCQDSNLGSRIQSPLPYRLATPQQLSTEFSPENQISARELSEQSLLKTLGNCLKFSSVRHGESRILRSVFLSPVANKHESLSATNATTMGVAGRLLRFAQVLLGLGSPLGVIKSAQVVVAAIAEQTAHLPGRMVVVYGQPSGAATDRTCAALLREQRRVGLWRDAVLPLTEALGGFLGIPSVRLSAMNPLPLAAPGLLAVITKPADLAQIVKARSQRIADHRVLARSWECRAIAAHRNVEKVRLGGLVLVDRIGGHPHSGSRSLKSSYALDFTAYASALCDKNSTDNYGAAGRSSR